MKLNRTREGWDHVWLEGGLFGYERDALEDIATLHAEVERLRGALASIQKPAGTNWLHCKGCEIAYETARQALGDTHD